MAVAGRLYVVGTPIGNLGDFSERGKKVLADVSFIAAEDTRVTIKLLNHFGIKKELVSYHAHNFYKKGEAIIARILNGEDAAIVSDAGMPCISDPGYELVADCIKYHIPVKIVPGPSAAVSALCISGLDTTRFSFEGFLSTNQKNRKRTLQKAKEYEGTLIFYEAPHKLQRTLQDLLSALGNRNTAIVKELTKVYENVLHTTLREALDFYKNQVPKGEYVILVEGKKVLSHVISFEEAVSIAGDLAAKGCKPTDAARQAAKQSGFTKTQIYKAMILNDRRNDK